MVEVHDLGLEGLYSLRFKLLVEDETNTRDEISEYLGFEIGSKYGAITTYPEFLEAENAKCVIVVIKKECVKYDICEIASILAHEAGHICDGIRNFTGMEYEDEFNSYHIGYFVKKMMNILKAHNDYSKKFIQQ